MSAVGGVNSPSPSPIFNSGGTNVIEAYRTTLCHSIMNQAPPKQLGFIGRACSSFGVHMYVSTLVCTGDARDVHKSLCTHWVGRTRVWS